MTDFLLEARDQGLYRAITDNGAGGLSSSIGEMAQLSGGACIDLSLAKTKYPGLKPYELMVSESQERMTLAVPSEHLITLLQLAERRGVEVSDLGSFTQTGYLEVSYAGKKVADLDLKFLHQGAPPLEIQARWSGQSRVGTGVAHQKSTPESSPEKLARDRESFQQAGTAVLLDLLSRPGIASKEWLIRQYDHEVQGTSVVKPLHTVGSGTATACSGPNDAGVVKPKTQSDLGLAVGCGINPKLSDFDPYWMAQSVVDEAVRNVLCVGAEFGQKESVFSLVDNFCWPDPVEDAEMAGALVRTCYGLRDAISTLSVPLISGKDSMKNNFRGKREGNEFSLAIPPTLLITAVARVRDVNLVRSADFKAFGDVIYLLGPARLGLVGSEFALLGRSEVPLETENFGRPDWQAALLLYSWLGGSRGKQQSRLRSLHDVSDGGVLVAVAESLLARGMGATLDLPSTQSPWEFAYGEGFHTFIASASVDDRVALEAEWKELGITYCPIGTVASHDRLEFRGAWGTDPKAILGQLTAKQIRSAWLKEGYWE